MWGFPGIGNVSALLTPKGLRAPFFLSIQRLPASCCFSLWRRGQGRGGGGGSEQRGRAEGSRLLRGPTHCSLTPHPWPHQMPLRSSPAFPRSLPGGHPFVLSPARAEDQTFHRGPAFQFFKLLHKKRCAGNSISKSSGSLCTGGILMNSSFILIFVQPTEASFSNIFHSHLPQKRKKYDL